MQASQPINLTNLPTIFKQYDTDSDGLVNQVQIDLIFKQIGYSNIYIGTIKKIIRLMNVQKTHQQNPEQKLNYNQIEQFANAFITEGKSKIWKAKYQAHQWIYNMCHQLYPKEMNEQNNAAPGAAGPGGPTAHKVHSDSQHGQINLNIGHANYNQHIEFSLNKQIGQQSIQSIQLFFIVKPYIKISIQRQTQQQAQKIETLFKKIYDCVIEIIKAEQEQLINQIMSISFITSVQNSTFTLFITTGNKDLVNLVQIYGQFLDRVMKQQINGKIEAKYKINFDFNKFITQENYNFYDMFVKDCQFTVKWNIWDLFKNLRIIVLNIDALKQLKFNVLFNELILIALLHCQKFTGVLQFQNTPTDDQQITSKAEITHYLKIIRSHLQQLQESTGLNILELIEQLDGKINIQAGIKDWKLNIQLKLEGLTKIIIKDIQCKTEFDDYD